MKIAVSTTSKFPSSTANSIQVLMACQGLVKNGQDIRLWFPGSASPSFETLRSHYCLSCEEFPITQLPSRPWLRRIDFSYRAVNEAAKWGADLVYTWTIQIALIASRRGIPVIFEAHDLPTGTFGKRWFREFVKSKSPKRIVLITHALKRLMQQQYPELQDSDCVIAPNAINAEDYSNLPGISKAKEMMGFSDRKIASCSGHLYQGRGVEHFLQLAQAFPQIDFYWYGGTPASVAFYREVVVQRMLMNVIFTGFIPKTDLPLAQAASDFLLMPYEKSIAGSSGGNSAAICSPMKLFEYLAVGRPILASDLPVFHEILDENSAIFCEPENVESWKSGLQFLLDHPENAQALGQAARDKSYQYTWQKRAACIIDSLNEDNYEG